MMVHLHCGGGHGHFRLSQSSIPSRDTDGLSFVCSFGLTQPKHAITRAIAIPGTKTECIDMPDIPVRYEVEE
jgi:hypothetical protein